MRRVGTDLGQGNRRGRSLAPLDPAMSWASRDISPELGRCCVCSCAFLSPSDTNNSKVRFDGGTQPPWTGGGPRRGADPDSLSGRFPRESLQGRTPEAPFHLMILRFLRTSLIYKVRKMNDSRIWTENQEICVGVLASLLTSYFILSKIYMEITKCLKLK